MQFRLRTDFTLPAPRAVVYDAVHDVDAWPHWWRGCERVVQLAPGRADGVGARHRIVWTSRLPYRLAIEVAVDTIVRGELIRGHSTGDLDGTGTWRFLDAAGGTHVQYLWEVELRKRWMQRLAPLLAPLFRLNHDWLMRNGAIGLAHRLRTTRPVVRNATLPA